MSRLIRYRESIKRYIKDKSCLFKKNNDIGEKVFSLIRDSDLILPCALLTVLNSR